MSRRRSKFAPKQDLSLEVLMPDRHELKRLGQDGAINPEAFAIRSEEAGRLRQAIQRLPPQFRIVLVLRDMEGLTDEEVGEITRLRAGTVRVRLHRSRLFVRKELMKDWDPDPRGHAHQTPSRVARPGKPRPARCKAMFAELSNYLDERLDDWLGAELEKHLNDCAPCQVFPANLQATIEECRKSSVEGPHRVRAGELRLRLPADYERLVAKNIRS